MSGVRVNIEYFAQARTAAGTATESLVLDEPATLLALICVLARRHGPKLGALLRMPGGEPSRTVIFAIDGEQVDAVSDPPLRDGQTIVIVPPISGGSGPPELTAEERAVYEWQMWVGDVGEEGQRGLKAARVLVTRVGGLGGQVAYQLAAAGVGCLILAHAGNVKPSDLNRQLLMTHAAIGTPRVECATKRLRELNPRLGVVAVAENVNADNAERLVSQADLVVDCAPLFSERLLLNEQAVRQKKPLVECAMYEFSVQVTTVIPGRTACLACRTPVEPPHWSRQFPVFGAVSGVAGCLGAVEAIKLICGVGEPLLDRLLIIETREMRFQTIRTSRNPNCPVCSGS